VQASVQEGQAVTRHLKRLRFAAWVPSENARRRRGIWSRLLAQCSSSCILERARRSHRHPRGVVPTIERLAVFVERSCAYCTGGSRTSCGSGLAADSLQTRASAAWAVAPAPQGWRGRTCLFVSKDTVSTCVSRRIGCALEPPGLDGGLDGKARC
jgi:hypothetical protein